MMSKRFLKAAPCLLQTEEGNLARDNPLHANSKAT